MPELPSWLHLLTAKGQDLLIALAYVAVAWVAAILLTRVLGNALLKLTARTATTLDERLVRAVRRPAVWLVVLCGLDAGLEHLQAAIPQLKKGLTTFEVHILPALVIAAGAFLAARVVNALLDWYLHELAHRSNATWDRELLPLAKRTASLIILFVALSMILRKFDVDVTALITTAGVASFAVAFAAQETLANMIAGFTLLVDRPFRVGDLIELADGRMGEVVEIGLRTTVIRQFDGSALIIPNKDIGSARLVNFGLPDARRAIRETIRVHFRSDVDRVKEVLLECLHAQPEILKDPAPAVYLLRFGESAIEFLAVGWVAHWREWFPVKERFLLTVWRRFREEGIVIPYPQQDVHLHCVQPPAVPPAGDRNPPPPA